MSKVSTIRLIWEMIKFGFKSRSCDHEWKFSQEIHGDYRNILGGRYEYTCTKCGKTKYTDVKV